MKTVIYTTVCCALLASCSDTIETGDPWSIDENEATEEPIQTPDPTPDPTDPTPDPVAFPSELAGNWAQEQIGNCIDFTTWLLFGGTGEMEHVLADRNACAPHSVTVGVGSWSQPTAHEVEYEWHAEEQWERRRTTFTIRDQTLHLAGYARSGDIFVHENEREGTLPGYYMHRVRVEVSFAEPIRDEACNMHVEIDAEIDLGANAAPLVASEQFDFDCEKSTNEVGSFVIAATSSSGRTSDRWSDEFSQRDMWDDHEPVMGSLLFSSFRPELNLSSPTANTAFTPGIWDANFQRRADEPPRTVEELDRND